MLAADLQCLHPLADRQQTALSAVDRQVPLGEAPLPLCAPPDPHRSLSALPPQGNMADKRRFLRKWPLSFTRAAAAARKTRFPSGKRSDCRKTPESSRGSQPSRTFNRAQRRVRWARVDFCAGKSHFPEQKSFPCSFCARKSLRFQQKLERVAVAGELASPSTSLSKPFLTSWPPLKGEVPATRAVGFRSAEFGKSDVCFPNSRSIRQQQVGAGSACR